MKQKRKKQNLAKGERNASNATTLLSIEQGVRGSESTLKAYTQELRKPVHP